MDLNSNITEIITMGHNPCVVFVVVVVIVNVFVAALLVVTDHIIFSCGQ